MRIRIIKEGLYGGAGALAVGQEFDLSGTPPAGWKGKYEVVSETSGKVAVTNPDRAARYADLTASLTDEDMTDGKPKTSALNALLDEGETKFDAAERDALHEAAS